MSRVITFGEIMMRLNPPGYLRFLQTTSFEATYAGGEANAAVSLANYKNDVAFVSKVPDNEIGQNAVNALRRYGVDISTVLVGGPRLGIYFCEKGASQRGSKVIYDRAGSSIALAGREEFDWDKIFDGADWFHFTGITPALGGELPEICLDACRAAKAKGLTVSCDLNYRGKLWTREKAGQVMAALMPCVDVCIANEEDAKDVFGIAAENTDINSGKLDREGYLSVARQLTERFGFKAVTTGAGCCIRTGKRTLPATISSIWWTVSAEATPSAADSSTPCASGGTIRSSRSSTPWRQAASSRPPSLTSTSPPKRRCWPSSAATPRAACSAEYRTTVFPPVSF